MDVEATTPLRRRNEDSKDTPSIDNPYQEKISSQMAIYKKLKSLVFLLLSSFLLHEMKVFHNILHSSKVDHLWFRSGMAASVAILAIKSYVELYQGKTKKQKVNYKNFRHETHAIMVLILFASLAFHISLWPVYGGWKTFMVMFAFGFGFLLQFILLTPVWAQNLLAAAAMTFFIQEYI
mmetsp:Transcript_10263/g.11745  ORF Transcript_10263/g.11745 Transcript_10263/m.11745 type:complete len:179 (+) Transcript_10263:71-607(+)